MFDINADITALADWLTARRFVLMVERGGLTVALEIKGLKGKALKAGAVFDRLNRAYDKLIETGDAHASDVEGLAPQIEAMQDDINFAVQTLGNSVGGSSDGGTKTPIEPVVLVPETAAPLTSGSAAPSEPVHE